MNRVSALGIGWRRHWTFLLLAAAVALIDQLSKFLVRATMSPGESLPSEGIVRLTYVRNTGGVFGLFPDQTFALIFTSFIGILALLLYYRYLSFQNVTLKIGLGLQLGGAVGNLVDRVRLGHVTDFLDLGAWPVFNLADSAIVIGLVIVAWFLLFRLRLHLK